MSNIVVSFVCGFFWGGAMAFWMRALAHHRLRLPIATWTTARAVLASRSKSRMYALMALVSFIGSAAISLLPAPADVPRTLYLVTWTLPLLTGTLAFVPPSVLILGSSRSSRSTKLIARLHEDLRGERMMTFLKVPPNHSRHGQELLTSFTPSSTTWGNFVHSTHSIREDQDWTKHVFALMRVAPVIVVDTRDDTEGLAEELREIGTYYELRSKTVLVGDVPSRRPFVHMELISGRLHEGLYPESEVKDEIEHKLPDLQILRFSGWFGRLWRSWPVRLVTFGAPLALAFSAPFLIVYSDTDRGAVESSQDHVTNADRGPREDANRETPSSDARPPTLTPTNLGAIGGGAFVFGILLVWFSTAMLESVGGSLTDAHQREHLRSGMPVSWLRREQHRDADPAYKSMSAMALGIACLLAGFSACGVALAWYLLA